MSISSSDILNLSHALKDICEVDCCTSPLLTQTLRLVAQRNLLQAHIEYGRTLSDNCCPDGCGGRKDRFDRHDDGMHHKDGSHRYNDEHRKDNHDHPGEHDRQRQERFNLNYIHEHPRADYDRNPENCDLGDCD